MMSFNTESNEEMQPKSFVSLSTDVTEELTKLPDDNGDAVTSVATAEASISIPAVATSVTGVSLTSTAVPDGIGICEFCGYRGRQDSFFSKSRRFCSRVCSRSYSSSKRDKSVNRPHNKTVEKKKALIASKNKAKLQLQGSLSSSVPSKQIQCYSSSFDWSKYLDSENAVAAPVTCFKHCPLSDFWHNVILDMKVEVVNNDTCLTSNKVYWIASVVRVAGYRAKVRYEGFGLDSSLDFWVNLCSNDVHPVGWCAASGCQLVPPRTIQNKYCDWKGFLVKVLTGARTLPQNFKSKINEELKKWPLQPSMVLEVVDRMCLSTMKVAVVDEVIGGRLKLRYINSEIDNDFFWCHSMSTLIHHVGWSQLVGHNLDASSDYKAASLSKATFKQYRENDSTPDMFVKMKDVSNNLHKFQIGMKLEAIDPLNLACICVSTVQKILNQDYLMIGIDGASSETEWFCYHVTSPYILPMGFCKINNLELTPPKGSKTPFNWYEYLQMTKTIAAPVDLFDKDIPNHGYRVGMKLEAVDLMEPSLICVATIVHVVGRLLKIHFDGWESAFDQWIDCQSPDIYPIGWSEIVSHHLEGPRPAELLDAGYRSLKKRSKTHVFKGNRKRRKSRLFSSYADAYSPSNLEVNDSSSQQNFYDTFSSPLGIIQSNIEKRDVLCEEMPTLSPLHSASGSERILMDMPDLLEADSVSLNLTSSRLSHGHGTVTSNDGEAEMEESVGSDIFQLGFHRHGSLPATDDKTKTLFTSPTFVLGTRNTAAESDTEQREPLSSLSPAVLHSSGSSQDSRSRGYTSSGLPVQSFNDDFISFPHVEDMDQHN